MSAPARTDLAPIDAAARNGRFQLVFECGNAFALVRYRAGRWEFADGVPLSWTPSLYRPGEVDPAEALAALEGRHG